MNRRHAFALSAALLGAVTGCARSAEGIPRPAPAVSRRTVQPMDGCTEAMMRGALAAAGGTDIERSDHVRIDVAIGPPARTVLGRCEEGEKLESCRARYVATRGERADVSVQTRRVHDGRLVVDGSERVVRATPAEIRNVIRELERQGHTVEYGRSEEIEIVQEAPACVRFYRTAQLSTIQLAVRGDWMRVFEAERAFPSMRTDGDERGNMWVRCRARDEAVLPEAIPAHGPCAALSNEARVAAARAGASCDGPLPLAEVRIIPGDDDPAIWHLYGVRRTSLWALLGLQNGDRVVRLCGNRLDPALPLLVRPIREYPRGCTFELRRRGEPFVIDVARACAELGPRSR